MKPRPLTILNEQIKSGGILCPNYLGQEIKIVKILINRKLSYQMGNDTHEVRYKCKQNLMNYDHDRWNHIVDWAEITLQVCGIETDPCALEANPVLNKRDMELYLTSMDDFHEANPYI